MDIELANVLRAACFRFRFRHRVTYRKHVTQCLLCVLFVLYDNNIEIN